MDEYMIILRLIHIVAGVYWVGAGMLFSFFLLPTVRAGNSKFLLDMITKTRYSISFPLSAVSTVVAGILMYWRVSDGFNADWMELDSSIVLSIGAVAGILALGHGGAVLGPLTGKYVEAASNAAETQALEEKMQQHSNISLALLVISVIGMATARYF